MYQPSSSFVVLKTVLISLLLSLLSANLISQNEFEINPTSITLPRTDTAAVINPERGMMIYDTIMRKQLSYNGVYWSSLSNQLDVFQSIGTLVDDNTVLFLTPDFIDAQGDFAYVIRDQGWLWVIDISDPTNPRFRSENIEPSVFVKDLTVIGDYAYMVSSGIEDALQVFDISNPDSTYEVGRITNNSITSMNNPEALVVRGDYAYVVSSESALQIIDISNPTNPIPVGKIIDDANTLLRSPIDLNVQGSYAFITSSFEDGVEIVDISDPSNPIHVGMIEDDTNTALEEARHIEVNGDFAYVSSEEGLEILDISNPALPIHVSSLYEEEIPLLQGINELELKGDYLFVSTSSQGLSIISVVDPDHPKIINTIVDNDDLLLNDITDFRIQEDLIFILSEGDAAVEIMRIPALHEGLGNELQQLSKSENIITLSGGGGSIDLYDGDSSVTNEIQILNRSNSTISLSNGGGSFTDEVNPFQTLSKSGATVTLSNGGGSFTDDINPFQTLSKSGATVSLSNGGGSFTDDDDWSNNGAKIYYNGGNIGINDSDPVGQFTIKQSTAGNNSGLRLIAHGNSNASWEIRNTGGTDNLRIIALGTPGTGAELSRATGMWSVFSDRRLKENIIYLDDQLERITKIRPSKYNWKEDIGTNEKMIGIIAQELELLFPEAVTTNDEGYKMVNYDLLGVLAIQAIKEQQVMLNDQQEAINKLIARVDSIEGK